MQIDWDLVETGETDVFDGTCVEIRGWFIALRRDAADYGLLVAEPPCCDGAIPGHAANSVEIFLARPIDATPRMLTLSGRWTRLAGDQSGWRHRLRDAQPIEDDAVAGVAGVAAQGRRLFLGAGAALGLVACSAGRYAPYADSVQDHDALNDAKALLAESVTIDVHSHAGRVILSRDPLTGPTRPFAPLARPMRDGGMNAICLAIVADTTATRVASDGKSFEPFRAPAAGEMYAHAQAAFARARALIGSQGLRVIDDAAALRAARSSGPSVVIASEGADFLEGRLDRVDEAHRLHGLRHLQLTHYRVNELGDIQTEAPVHGGLTDFGADVVRRCNALGIVVDVAHGTYALVQRAAAVTTKPLV
ncbi:MAG: membrane dipeptidase, partial [Caldimonas sp.]